MADPWVVVSYSNAQEHAFVQKLVDYLSTKNIYAEPVDPNLSEPTTKRQLLDAQWLVLVLTPEAIRSFRVQSLVNAAFGHVKQGHMQGVLALAFLSNPVESEEMPYPWSTIRTYYTGDSDEDHQQAFEKLSRTLGYTRVPVHAVSSPAGNWASSFSSAASRPLPAIPQHPPKPRARVAVLAFSLLVILALIFVFSVKQIGSASSTQSALNATTPTHALSVAQTRATTVAANATATAVSLAAPYRADTSGTPDFISLDAQHDSKLWQQDSACILNPDSTYQVTSTPDGHDKVCMASNLIFTNFAYQIQMTIESGDTGGLIFRSEGAKQFYRFSLNSNGRYVLLVICQSSICSSPTINS